MSLLTKIKQVFKSQRAKNGIASVATVLLAGLLYSLVMLMPAGIATYLASILPLAIICVTAVVRANDMSEKATAKRWHVRRLGLTLVAGTSMMFLLGPLSVFIPFPSWTETLLYWGFALTWLTTPGMPPWWKWIARGDKKVEHPEHPQVV